MDRQYNQRAEDERVLKLLIEKYDLKELLTNQRTFIYVFNTYDEQAVLCCPTYGKELIDRCKILSRVDADTLHELLVNLRHKGSIGFVMTNHKNCKLFVNTENCAKTVIISLDENNNIKLIPSKDIPTQHHNLGILPISIEHELEA